MSRRHKEEFYCDVAGGGCGMYFYTFMRENMFGNYKIECPSCEHHHYRVVEKGLVTQERFSERHGPNIELIRILKSTLSKTPWHNDPDFRRQQLKAYGIEETGDVCNTTPRTTPNAPSINSGNQPTDANAMKPSLSIVKQDALAVPS